MRIQAGWNFRKGQGNNTVLMILLDSTTPALAAPNTYEIFHGCPDCPEMVVVPAAECMMGSAGYPIRHKVTISKSFAVNLPNGQDRDKYEPSDRNAALGFRVARVLHP
jgi:formylglycine-generating enzyme required for sulfatase activity